MKNQVKGFDEEVAKSPTQAQELKETEHIEAKIPESQGDLADRAENEIESDLQWRIEMIRRASREDQLKRMQSRE